MNVKCTLGHACINANINGTNLQLPTCVNKIAYGCTNTSGKSEPEHKHFHALRYNKTIAIKYTFNYLADIVILFHYVAVSLLTSASQLARLMGLSVSFSWSCTISGIGSPIWFTTTACTRCFILLPSHVKPKVLKLKKKFNFISILAEGKNKWPKHKMKDSVSRWESTERWSGKKSCTIVWADDNLPPIITTSYPLEYSQRFPCRNICL